MFYNVQTIVKKSENMLPHRKQIFVMLLWVVGMAAGCRQDSHPPTVVPTLPAVETIPPSPTSAPATPVAIASATPPPAPTVTPPPAPRKEVTICLGQEPETLYLHAGFALSRAHVWQALYENLYTELDYAYQTRGLTKIPTLASDDLITSSMLTYSPHTWG